jgi:hypothetical protein
MTEKNNSEEERKLFEGAFYLGRKKSTEYPTEETYRYVEIRMFNPSYKNSRTFPYNDLPDVVKCNP